MWVMVPMQTVIKNFFATIPGYPFQTASSLSAGSIGYATLREQEALERLQKIETITLHQ
jgi:arylsulfatase